MLTDPADYPALLRRVQDTPGGLYVSFEFGSAGDIKQCGGEATTAFVRLWPDDNIQDLGESPRDWCYRAKYEMVMQLGEVRQDIFVQCGNEPHDSRYLEWRDWTLEAMREARALGLRLAVGAFGMGHPVGIQDNRLPDDEKVIQQWITDFGPILDALQDDWHVLCLHEYHDYGWGRPQGTTVPWLWGRVNLLIQACLRSGRNVPTIGIGEFNGDSCEHGHLKGYRAIMRALGLSEADIAADVKWAHQTIYTPLLRAGTLLGIAWFGYGRGWPDFSAEGCETLLAALNSCVAGAEEAEEEEPQGCSPVAKLRAWWGK